MRTVMAGLAKFERHLIRDRVKSGLAAAKARGVKLGRQVGQCPSHKKAKKVLAMHKAGLSYRLIGRNEHRTVDPRRPRGTRERKRADLLPEQGRGRRRSLRPGPPSGGLTWLRAGVKKKRRPAHGDALRLRRAALSQRVQLPARSLAPRGSD